MSKEKRLDLKWIREHLGLTQVEFAAKVGVNPITISRWERGISKPSKLALKRLQRFESDLDGKRKK
jgi:putative transcriptional regulator